MRDAVLSSPAGYTLASDMRVDLDIIRQALISSQTRGGPSPATLQTLEPAFEALLARDVTRAARWEWFAQTERDLEETLRGIAAQLGRAALAQGDTQRALEIARLLAARDPADEEACELAMRSLLAAGDAAAARRELQHYEAHAATDLGIAVLSPLRQLLPRSTT
ncbi:MAG: BTAD domain-containing putative transcriptional regulator [Candidatus Velthaea sp.]